MIIKKVSVVWVWSQSKPPFKKSAYAPDLTLVPSALAKFGTPNIEHKGGLTSEVQLY